MMALPKARGTGMRSSRDSCWRTTITLGDLEVRFGNVSAQRTHHTSLQTLPDGRVRIIGDTLGHVEASVPPRRPASGRIRAMDYRVYSLLEASHAM